MNDVVMNEEEGKVLSLTEDILSEIAELDDMINDIHYSPEDSTDVLVALQRIDNLLNRSLEILYEIRR